MGRGRVAWEGDSTLDMTRPGDEFEIVEVGDERARMHALRFGMAEGARVSCVTRVPAGPIVLKCGRQEIAVGRHLARRIRVRRYQQGVA
jgi:ferrous iron transport protein A